MAGWGWLGWGLSGWVGGLIWIWDGMGLAVGNGLIGLPVDLFLGLGGLG